MIRVGDIARIIEAQYPLDYAVAGDNCGLQIGNPESTVRTILVALDPSPPVVARAVAAGADLLVTPCPFCPLHLDGLQSTAAKQNGMKIDLPILHLPQLLGLAMGMTPQALGLNRNLVETESVLDKLGVSV